MQDAIIDHAVTLIGYGKDFLELHTTSSNMAWDCYCGILLASLQDAELGKKYWSLGINPHLVPICRGSTGTCPGAFSTLGDRASVRMASSESCAVTRRTNQPPYLRSCYLPWPARRLGFTLFNARIAGAGLTASQSWARAAMGAPSRSRYAACAWSAKCLRPLQVRLGLFLAFAT